MKNALNEIADQTVERYSKRYSEFGYDVKTLGWGSVGQQKYRFGQTLELEDLRGLDVLDVGCGFGDYADFLDKAGISYSSYTGFDINSDLLQEAKKRREGQKDCHFRKVDMSNFSGDTVADVGVMLGVLNFNLNNYLDNYEYSFQVIKNAFKLVRKSLIVDFLSTNLSPDYPKEDFVFYHDPVRVLDFALSLSSNVALKHDYLPIPQKEFMLCIRK